jgi:hypothetical protein
MSRSKASKNRRRTKNIRVTKKNRTRRNRKIGGTLPDGYSKDDMKQFKQYIRELDELRPLGQAKKNMLMDYLSVMPYEPDYVFNYTGKKKPMDTYGQGIDRIQSYNQSIN